MADTTQTIALNADLAPLNASLAAAAKTSHAFADGPVAERRPTIERAINRSFNSVAQHHRARRRQRQNLDGPDGQRHPGRFRPHRHHASSSPSPLEGIIASIIGSVLPVSGARAAGGPVNAGAAYLVGEQRPELFVPGGERAPSCRMRKRRAPADRHERAGARAQSFLKSESQIAAMLSRALARGTEEYVNLPSSPSEA